MAFSGDLKLEIMMAVLILKHFTMKSQAPILLLNIGNLLKNMKHILIGDSIRTLQNLPIKFGLMLMVAKKDFQHFSIILNINFISNNNLL
jgi:hypothetical protein